MFKPYCFHTHLLDVIDCKNALKSQSIEYHVNTNLNCQLVIDESKGMEHLTSEDGVIYMFK